MWGRTRGSFVCRRGQLSSNRLVFGSRTPIVSTPEDVAGRCRCAAKRSDTTCGKLRVGGFIFTCENTGEYADVHFLVGDGDGKAFVPAHQLILKNFPSDICRLSNLLVLYLGGNALIDVPDTIGQLSELTSLGLADNRLKQIPTAIASYRNLRNLALHNNRLKKFLPPRIVRLKNLEDLSLRNNPLVTDVNEIPLEPPSFNELAARVVKIRFSPTFCRTMLPGDLLGYFGTANQCVNPKCKGVYFEACAEFVKFIDFCGKYRVPLLHYLCFPRCSTNTPAYAYSSGSSASESDDDHSQHFRHHHRAHQETPSDSFTSISANAKMKVFLGLAVSRTNTKDLLSYTA
ncbi:hypothetical protein niasHT_005693 [Heterodera trifolii]|uniref:Uncharacterized protein n=1 Tax=Heterodera trifolii TaxID=157864 RepID=A0ABD2M813_9BILA